MRKLLLLALALLPAAQAQGGDPLSPLLEFARAQPGDLAVFVASVRSDGSPDPTRPALVWNAGLPMPLASTRKIVVLAAYARAVGAGKLDPQAPVNLSEWESFYLPGTDGGAHANSLKALNLPADAQGRALDGSRSVPLETVARFMIETSDNAATDLLMTRLGREKVAETRRAFNLSGQEEFGPISGLFLAWADAETRGEYAAWPMLRRVSDSWSWAALVSRTPALRGPEALSRTLPGGEELLALVDATDARGTVNDYAGLMARVLTGAGLTPAEREIMARHLGWPMRAYPENAQVFSAFYAKGGSLPGVLTNTFGLQPRLGPWTGQKLVVSVFLRRVPENRYGALRENLDQAMLLLATAPSEAQRLADVLKAARP